MTVVPAATEHGGDAARVAVALGLDPNTVIDLSASMNPFAPNVARVIVAELERADRSISNYPDAVGPTAQLAEMIGVDPDLVVLTNGGAEAIALVAAEVGIGQVIEPEFSLYRRHLESIDPNAPRWRSNPSNPLGALAQPGDVAGVWDEAFYPLATGTWTRNDSAAWRLGSLTKLWNCPGLRLGFVIASDPASAQRIRRRQPQWAVNGLALAVLPELLRLTNLAEWHSSIAHLRADFGQALTKAGYDVRPTAANWVLVDSVDLRARLAPLGVIVRDCASFGLHGLHRVALPSRDQFDRVVQAFTTAGERGTQWD
jgi:histidinol-phosphate/aromatic aminotransferase/cobyric acid decarboxylase-like protein